LIFEISENEVIDLAPQAPTGSAQTLYERAEPECKGIREKGM